jgi:nitrogen PTS system EIIA component
MDLIELIRRDRVETLGSTGVGSGIVVPHARLKDLAEFTGLFARLERPIDFAAIDGKPVDLVFLLLSPTWSNTQHVAALAAVSRRLRDRPVADAIRSTTSAPEIHTLLMG